MEGNKRMKWGDALLNRVGMMVLAKNKELHKEKTDFSVTPLEAAWRGWNREPCLRRRWDAIHGPAIHGIVQPSTLFLLSSCKSVDVTVWCLLH